MGAGNILDAKSVCMQVSMCVLVLLLAALGHLEAAVTMYGGSGSRHVAQLPGVILCL